MLRRILQGVGIGVVSACLALLVWRAHPRWMVQAEAVTWDWRVRRLAAPSPATDRIRLVFLDQYSLDWGKERGWSWPWPRQVYAPLLDFCRRGEARAVAFDVIFSEPSSMGADDDAQLGAAIARTGGFVGALFLGETTGSLTNWPDGTPRPAWRLRDDPAVPGRFVLPHAAFPIPEVATNAALLATVSGNPDGDGVYRRLNPLSLFDGVPVPALGLGAALADARQAEVELRTDALAITPPGRELPVDRRGRVILRYRGPSQTHATVNVAAVIDSELLMREGRPPVVEPAFFKDKYVFFGFTAPGLYDLKSSPLSAAYPGVEVHATFLDNLLAGDFMRDAARGHVALVCLLLAVLAALAVRLGHAAWQNVLVMVALLPAPVLLGFYAYTRGVWLPMVVQWSALAPALVGTLALNYATEGRQKRFIKGAFKQYLSPVLIDELVQHPERLTLGGETRDLSIFFSDVKGFTSISERLSPEQLTALLNQYLTEMTEIIYRHGGTVDKYEGDAIIAFWNAPLGQPNHALCAVKAALDCQDRLAALRPLFKERIGADMYQRIGINSGPVVVGNMGSRQRFNYTFLGDAGNLASRLEGLNKQFGTSILISEYTHAQLGATVAAREISRVQVVGRKQAVRVFEPLTPGDADAHSAELAAFAQALTDYYTGAFEKALAGFLSLESHDGPAAAYVRRCRELLANPPSQWEGVWTMTEK